VVALAAVTATTNGRRSGPRPNAPRPASDPAITAQPVARTA
jgi:hypothetical protein